MGKNVRGEKDVALGFRAYGTVQRMFNYGHIEIKECPFLPRGRLFRFGTGLGFTMAENNIDRF
jgi:hypothetical protein